MLSGALALVLVPFLELHLLASGGPFSGHGIGYLNALGLGWGK